MKCFWTDINLPMNNFNDKQFQANIFFAIAFYIFSRSLIPQVRLISSPNDNH